MRVFMLMAASLAILAVTGFGNSNTAFRPYRVTVRANSLDFPAPAQTTTVTWSVAQ